MSRQLSAVAFTTVQDLEPTPSGRFVRVHFTPVRVPGAYARHPGRMPWASDAPVVGSVRMGATEVARRDIRTGDLVSLELEGEKDRPVVGGVVLEARGRSMSESEIPTIKGLLERIALKDRTIDMLKRTIARQRKYIVEFEGDPHETTTTGVCNVIQ